MASKSNFTPEEWSRLVASPVVAGMAITAADPGGLWSLLQESMSSGWALLEAKQDAVLVLGDVARALLLENRAAGCAGLRVVAPGKGRQFLERCELTRRLGNNGRRRRHVRTFVSAAASVAKKRTPSPLIPMPSRPRWRKCRSG